MMLKTESESKTNLLEKRKNSSPSIDANKQTNKHWECYWLSIFITYKYHHKTQMKGKRQLRDDPPTHKETTQNRDTRTRACQTVQQQQTNYNEIVAIETSLHKWSSSHIISTKHRWCKKKRHIHTHTKRRHKTKNTDKWTAHIVVLDCHGFFTWREKR